MQEILENAGKESDEPVADDKESSGDDEESSNDLDENGKKIISEELRKKIMSEF